ncbi:MAG: bifunctional precorrin-2 dehydrogenase/sirohydrochlorin ferrochelatase [Acidobacteria bacterium]|nr:bifunctional precorrin-2 dehydrogenase/sirohydrochlorin ferrochelatase [Acidobacteriota bacterium]
MSLMLPAQEAELHPAFLKLAGRQVVIVGGGPVAAAKLKALRPTGAHLVVVAPSIGPEIEQAAAKKGGAIPNPELRCRPWLPADLDEAWFVVAAATPEVNREVTAAAEERRLFVNAVDDPVNATAYAGGVLRRSGVTIAVSTGGHAPALAGLLREGLEILLPDDLDRWMDEARRQRRLWKTGDVAMPARRPLLLSALNALYGPGASQETRP